MLDESILLDEDKSNNYEPDQDGNSIDSHFHNSIFLKKLENMLHI